MADDPLSMLGFGYDRPFEQNCVGAEHARTPRDELLVFLIIVTLVWPIRTVGVVGGYGFAVWMYQLVAGPRKR
jgi:periplasmic nitrate reductase NapE